MVERHLGQLNSTSQPYKTFEEILKANLLKT
jgi:hypothetical protein